MWGKAAISSVLLLAGALVVAARAEPVPVPLARPLYALPATLGEWEMVSSGRLRPEIQNVLGGDQDLTRRYVRADGTTVSLMLIYWERQSGDRMIHDPETCLPGAGWSIESSGGLTLREGALPVYRFLAEREDASVLFYLWYVQAGHVQSNTLERRLAMTKSYFSGRTDGAMVRVLVQLGGREDSDSAESALRSFAETLAPALEGVLPQ